jgi:hypothetical protein
MGSKTHQNGLWSHFGQMARGGSQPSPSTNLSDLSERKSMTNQEKLEKAINYLRSRGIYLLDGGYTPTKAVNTDIAQTIARYRAQVEKKALIRGVK